jgi:hypothetical protein
MDYLESSISLMDEPTKKSFRAYLQRVKLSERTLQLFDLISSNPETDGPTLAQKLYKPINLNAYHSLRKSLLAQIEEFVTLREITNTEHNPQRVLSMAKYFLENNDRESSTSYLKKAALLAEKNHDYQMLDAIYLLQIDKAHELQIDPELVIEKWGQNKSKLVLQQRLSVANSILRKKLSEARKSGTTLDPQEITDEVLQLFDLRGDEALIAEFMLKAVQMIRSAVVSSKDYSRFEPFIRRVYQQLESAGAFTKQNENTRQQFIYMIAHTFYRTRKLKESNALLESISNYSNTLKSRFVQLNAAVLSFSGNNERGIEILRSALKSTDTRFTIEDRLNMRLNLVVFYFQSEEFKKANVEMLLINHSDTWLEKRMGKEWRFKKSMIDVILQCELGNTDLAFSRIKNMEKYFAGFFQHPAYQRALIFMRFVKTIIEQPERVAAPEFAIEVDKANMAWPDYKEDTQAITFFCWLKSKMIRRPYYEVLLQAMN